ncbi:hypothetical protein GCM10009837_18620 [Streptomyces durmitorensis]
MPVYVSHRGSGRAGRHMWVGADDCEIWRELDGEKEPLPVAPEQEEDDRISEARPIRDLGQPTGGLTLPRMPLQRSVKPMLITSVERAAASAAVCRAEPNGR